MDAVDVLMEARAYVDKGWCQGSDAQDAQGLSVDVHSAAAEAWCVEGALERVAWSPLGALRARAWGQAINLFEQAVGGDPSFSWQDAEGRTKEEVLEAFDRAISLGLREAGDR